MVYPHVTEVVRAGSPALNPFPRSQRERVELSLRVKPSNTARSVVRADRRRGIFR